MSTKYPFHMRIVRSDGAELELGDGTEWVLSMNGMDDWLNLDYSVETSANVLTDGSALVSKRVAEKDRTISATYWGRDRTGERDRVIPFFNPKYSFEAHVTYFDRTRWCEGEQLGFDMPITDERTPPTLTWTLLCLDPYMRSEDDHDETMRDAVPMLGWPFVSHTRHPALDGTRKPVGFLVSKMIYDGVNTIYNFGDVQAPFKVVCDFDGDVISPSFVKDGKKVQVIWDFHDGDMLEIDFTKAPPRVEINGENAIHLCSRDSNFTHMVMDVGANTFNYTCKNEANRPLMNVRVMFNARYLGV